MATAISTLRRRGPRAPTRRGYRHPASLPVEPTGVEALAAVKRARQARDREHEWDARVEASALAVLAYLWRRARGEKWAGAGGSARYACSLAQLVAGLAPIMGWKPGTPDQLVARHRKTVQRWLDWLQDAGLVSHTPQQDEAGFWWRTIITLHACPELDAQLLEDAADRHAGWSSRERRRDARGRQRSLTAILRRARLTRAQRRHRAIVRRRAERVHSERQAVRARIHQSLASATVAGSMNCPSGHQTHPYGVETTSRSATQSKSKEDLLGGTFTRARALIAPTPTPQLNRARTASRPEGDGSAAAATIATTNPPAARSRAELDDTIWQIAREASNRWRSRPTDNWQPFVHQIQQRTRDLEAWPTGHPAPRWRLTEAWTTIAWGVEYAAAGVASRLSMWSQERHGARLNRAVARYERHADHRPSGWPDSGAGGLVRFLRHQHPEPGAHPRCLSYDVRAFDRWTKQLAAYAATRDLDTWQTRARERVARRASSVARVAGDINRRLPERAWLRPASSLVPRAYPTPGPERKQRRLTDRDRQLLAGKMPLSAGTLHAAWAYEDRWLEQ